MTPLILEYLEIQHLKVTNDIKLLTLSPLGGIVWATPSITEYLLLGLYPVLLGRSWGTI